MSSFFQKLSLGLKKTSGKISDGISGIFTTQKIDSKTMEDLEELLISADLGVKAASKIIKNFSNRKFDKNISESEIKNELCKDMEELLKPLEKEFCLSENIKPFVILMVGVNGAGKTTTIGKLASKLKMKGKQISFIAADTFRAAAVEQLQVWGDRNKIRVYSGENGCDSAGLCYDGLNAALKAGDDIVFIDTAGRLQNKSDLMDELKKVVRVIKKVMPEAPHQTLLTIDATTGQNAVAQVQTFNQSVDVDGLVVTKLDGSAKGGILAAIAEETPIPVYFVGVGENIEDLDVFDAAEYAKGLLAI